MTRALSWSIHSGAWLVAIVLGLTAGAMLGNVLYACVAEPAATMVDVGQ